MKKNEIMNKVSRSFGKVGFKLKKHSPEILAVTGTIGVVTSAVMACKATTKLGDILEKSKKEIELIKFASEHPEELPEEYTEEDGKNDIRVSYAHTVVDIVKLYAPSVILGTLSITAMLTSNNILRKRNIALAAAYTAVDKGFKEYRSRVVERFGEEIDKEIRYNLKSKEIEETIVDEKTGKEKTVKKTVNVIDPSNYSVYARFYDDGCNGWTKNPEDNLYFLKCQENYANDLLKTRGHLFLNEVYDMIGIPRTQAGQMVGWIYDEKNPIGDNFVDFGILDLYNEKARDFVNGYERTILLDFNVDGEIFSNL
jgi:hypothetical protein